MRSAVRTRSDAVGGEYAARTNLALISTTDDSGARSSQDTYSRSRRWMAYAQSSSRLTSLGVDLGV